MDCPKCHVELVKARDWAYCPQCNQSYNKADLELREHEEAQRLREELASFQWEA